MNINRVIAEELGVRDRQVQAAVELLDSGNTVPFIARYRKEATGSLNDEQLRLLQERLTYLRTLQERKDQVISVIEEQGKLSGDLQKKIEEAVTLAQVEDLYLPYRPKRRTRASIARERGLEPLADIIKNQCPGGTVSSTAERFIDPSREVPDVQAALQGALDILAEDISDTAEYREFVRKLTGREGVIVSSAKEKDDKSVYETFFQYEEKASAIPGHRILGLNRAEKEKAVTVKLETPEERILSGLEHRIIRKKEPQTEQLLKEAVKDSYTRLIAPSIEREIRTEMTERAEDGAIEVFGKNLRQLLMQPPLEGETVLGWDPAFRTGCKLAVVDATGKVLDTAVIFPTMPTNEAKQEQARKKLTELIRKYHVSVISVGNGTASRESEIFIAEYLKTIPEKVSYVIVNEAGASVYSASELASKEFPKFDVGQRSAASIARRLQDPMAELVKIDPKSIGVGQYQHDLNQKKLSLALDHVVEDCVNSVGVDLNTASAALLEHISGITRTTAANIVAYREENGRFEDRKQLKKVPKLGPKAFEQSAGFLRVRGGRNPLDMTSVHPESYSAAEALLKAMGHSLNDVKEGKLQMLPLEMKSKDRGRLAQQLGIGLPTLDDIVRELSRPGRDVREDMPKPILRSDVLDMKDLKPGMHLKGTVRNVIDFGAFVDIGVHQDGLVHISQMSDSGFVKHPLDVVHVGDIIEVRVLSVDPDKKRIALTMKKEDSVHERSVRQKR